MVISAYLHRYAHTAREPIAIILPYNNLHGSMN